MAVKRVCACVCVSIRSLLYKNKYKQTSLCLGPVWARGRCRISPPRFLAECCKRQLNQVSLVLLYFRLSTFSDLYWVCLSVFSLLFCLSVSVKWLAVKTASEMTYTVSSGVLNSTPTPSLCLASCVRWQRGTVHRCMLLLQQSVVSSICSAHSNKPATCCCSGQIGLTDGRTSYCLIDPAPHTVRAVPVIAVIFTCFGYWRQYGGSNIPSLEIWVDYERWG